MANCSAAAIASSSSENSMAALSTRPAIHANDMSISPVPEDSGKLRLRSSATTPARSRSLATAVTSQSPPFTSVSSSCVAPIRNCRPSDSGSTTVPSRESLCCSLRTLRRLIPNVFGCSSPGKISSRSRSSASTSMSPSSPASPDRCTGKSLMAIPWIHHSPLGSWRTSRFVPRITTRLTTSVLSAISRVSATPMLTCSAAITRDIGAPRLNSAS